MAEKIFLNKPAVILISGKAYAGKTTLAKYLKDVISSNGYDVDVFSFGKQVKEVCSWFGWNGLKDERGRKLLQSIGMAIRDYEPDFWVDYLYKFEINDNIRFPFDFVIIDDNRFVNEIEYFRKRGYQIFTVRVANGRLGLFGELAEDRSENSLPEDAGFYFDIIYNTGTFEDLHNMSKRLFDKIIESTEKF